MSFSDHECVTLPGRMGIDTGKDHLSCALLFLDTLMVEAAHPTSMAELKPRWEGTLARTEKGVAELLKHTPPGVPWVIEPTGRFSLGVVQQAQAAGQKVFLAPPKEAKGYLKSLNPRAKTDKLDGRGLALYGLTHRLNPYPLKSEAVDQIDQLLSARRGLSRSLSQLRLQQSSLTFMDARDALGPPIVSLKAQIDELDARIARFVQKQSDSKDPALSGFRTAKALLKVPGIGPVTAAAVTSRLISKQFPHPDKFVAYIGLDIRVRQSGKRENASKLTKHGDAELRRLLYVCAMAAARAKDNPFKEQYQREQAKGLSTTEAFCSVARKLAMVCWSLHKHKAAYDPKRVNALAKDLKKEDPLDKQP